MQELFLWISKIIILTYPIKPVKLGRWLGMAVNIYSGGPTRLRTYYKSALRALEASLLFFIFFSDSTKKGIQPRGEFILTHIRFLNRRNVYEQNLAMRIG